MKFSKKVVLSGLLAILMASCAEESPWGDSSSSGSGSIKLLLSSNSGVSSKIPDVRSIASDIVAPDASDFKIRIVSEDESYEKVWNSIDEFEEEPGFKVGKYILEAYYGSPSSQGVVAEDEAGHEHSYFYGRSTLIEVEAGKTSTVQVQASLANSVVIIEYTDAFTNYFTDWSTTLNTEGEQPVELGNKEGKCYVIPGDVDVIISATQQNGKKVRVNPAVFKAEPQHLYKIRYNIYNGEIGEVDKIEITFDDGLDGSLPIFVDLTEDLLAGDGPVIDTEGFESGADNIEALSGSAYNGDLRFNVASPDGIVEAKLTLVTEGKSSFDFLNNGSVDLCSLDNETKAKMESQGIRILGFGDATSKMALLEVSRFVENLPVGKNSISLVVKDKAGRLSETKLLNINSLPIELDLVAKKMRFGDDYAEISLFYNGSSPLEPGGNPFSFKVKGDSDPENVEIISINGEELTRAFDKKEYVYRIRMPYAFTDEYPVDVYFHDSSNALKSTTVEVEYPSYDVEYDAFAKKLLMRVAESDINGDEAKRKLYTERLRIFRDNQELTSNITRNTQTGIVTISGFEAGKNIGEFKTSMEAKASPEKYYGEETIFTEEELGVPNGDFESLTQRAQESINQGGSWATSGADRLSYYNTATFTIAEAVYWTSSNIKTMGGSNKNTWFYIPSVFNTTLKYVGSCPGVGLGTGSTSGTPDSYTGFKTHSGNAMVIRNVSWDPVGSDIAKDTSGGSVLGIKGTGAYYNYNVPETTTVSAGKFFLGEYPTSENPEDAQGVSFASRPMKLKGWYTYKKDDSGDDDHGVAKVIVFNNDKIISQGQTELPEVSEMTEFGVTLDNYNFMEKATRIVIYVTSSKYASTLADFETQNIKVTTYLSKIASFKHGATLVIDHLTFDY